MKRKHTLNKNKKAKSKKTKSNRTKSNRTRTVSFMSGEASRELSTPIQTLPTPHITPPVTQKMDEEAVDPRDLLPYLNFEYVTVNAYLRGQLNTMTDDEIETAKKEIVKIDKVFQVFGEIVETPFVVYRGLKRHFTEYGYNPAYSSTSVKSFGVAITSYAGRNSDFLVLQLMPGVRYLNINKIVPFDEDGYYPEEAEILLDRGVHFVVTKMFTPTDPENPNRVMRVYTYFINVYPA